MDNQNISCDSFFTCISADVLVSSTVLGLCCVLGVPGNLAVLVLLARHIKEGSFTPKLMLSLAVSDLLSLIFLPVWIYALLNGWVFGQALCKLFSYVVYWSLYSSVLSVTLLSVQRYLQVLYPQRWAKLGQKGQKGLIFGIWTLGGTLASYALYFRNVKLKKDGLLHCYQDYTTHHEKVIFLLFENLVMFVLPLCSLLSFYFQLHRRINQSASFRRHRLTKLAIRIVVTFFIFGTPCMINNFVDMAVSWESDISYNVTGALFFINSCVNPFLYAFSARTLLFRLDSDQPNQNESSMTQHNHN
ncbi:leukotriene B4 receptor 1-like [Danio rerio]|uniref:Leukotriene B4 receptor 1-like n=2 Tax=Danio rerio TaxID=7955 RepID=A0A8M9QED8_DANRE|nr:leukotriene B4 receptor 1-like [Danio rerio]XP_021332025.1 leukotriene B4 receptor 1-like [Danio rerio]|eukprot:XP_017211748.1 leukotriene B4 receptor 1-like [Danio rerio]